MVVLDVTEPAFGPLLRGLREAAGMSQRELAGKIFRHNSRISRLQSGEIAGPEAIMHRLGTPGEEGAVQERVRNIVRMCYRLPLGIHLIASRFRDNATLTLEDIEAALRDKDTRLGEIDNGERSLAAVFATSHAMLPEQERTALAALSVHPGVWINRYSAAVLLETGPREAESVVQSMLIDGLVWVS